MDKKCGRSVQPLTKGANFDKKTQDNNGKLWTKAGYRREAASGSLSVKPEVVRKNCQRFRTSDKRPRPRGQQDVVVRDEASSLEDPSVELGSVYLPGSKKTNISHLTNFTFTPRNGVQRENVNRGLFQKNGNYCLKRFKYAKEHFLQANCQFVVNSSGDYKQHLSNPDALVDWNYIEQINIQVNDSPLCPICRFPPSAAKITRCGHIYCWSCFLHYLDLSENSYQKCPICFQNVYGGDLKSVIIITQNTFNIGETITFKLMKRNENSLTPFPASERMEKEHSFMNFSADEPSKIYCKLLLAQNSDICTIINREKRELEDQLLNAEDTEVSFIEKAAIYNQSREAKVLGDMVNDVVLGETPPRVSFTGIGKTLNCVDDISKPRSTSKYIYFYQACDGQHIYIHSFNVKMLKHTYGSLEYAPTTITAKILSKESDYMSEEYRKCFKYLAHLPVTCPFETMEIELNDSVVTQETLDFFHAELDDRRKRRLKKAKEEKIRERRITEEENLKIYKRYPEAHIPLESTEQFPSFGSPPDASSYDLYANMEQNEQSSSSQDYSGPSFAKMAASVKTQSNQWPNLGSSAIAIVPSSSKHSSLSVISGRRRYNSNCTTTSEEQEGIEPEFVPEARMTFGDAIAQALQKASKNDPLGSPGCGEKGKKKKKAKPRVLMSTSSSFGYS